DAGDGGVEQPALARALAKRRAVLVAGQVRAQRAEQVQRRLHRLRVLQVAGDDTDAIAAGRLDLRGHDIQRLIPGRGPQLAVLADVRTVEALASQAVDGVA